MRIVAILVCGAALAVGGAAGSTSASVRTQVGPTRLLAPGFGYSVAYRTVERGARLHTTTGLFLYEDGRWRNVAPQALAGAAIDDVAFVDRRHGWVAAYDCGRAAV